MGPARRRSLIPIRAARGCSRTRIRTVFNSTFCDPWSPDGTRLACGLFSEATGNSVYTIRSSDGGGLKKVVSCDAISPGAECGPNDYSPDGKQLLLEGPDQNGEAELFVVKLNGSGLRQLTPTGTRFEGDGVELVPERRQVSCSARRWPPR